MDACSKITILEFKYLIEEKEGIPIE